MGTSIVRIPNTGALDVQFRHDPRQASKKKSQVRDFDYLHHVNDGQQLYLDPDTHQKLIDAGAAAGDVVRLMKVRRGQETTIDGQVLSDAQEAEHTPTPELPPASVANPLRTASIRPPQQATVRTSAPAAAYVAGAAAPQLPPAPASADKPLPRPAAQTLAGALYSAVDAALACEEYARAKGRALAFSSEDVRCMALSIYISSERGNR